MASVGDVFASSPDTTQRACRSHVLSSPLALVPDRDRGLNPRSDEGLSHLDE